MTLRPAAAAGAARGPAAPPKKKHKKPAPPPAAVSVDPLKEADAKLAAGDGRRRRAARGGGERDGAAALSSACCARSAAISTARSTHTRPPPTSSQALPRARPWVASPSCRTCAEGRRPQPLRPPRCCRSRRRVPDDRARARRSARGKADEAWRSRRRPPPPGAGRQPPRRSATRRRRMATWPRPRPPTVRRAADPAAHRGHRPRDGPAQDRPRGRGGADAREGDRARRRAPWRPTRNRRGSRSRCAARDEAMGDATSPPHWPRTIPRRSARDGGHGRGRSASLAASQIDLAIQDLMRCATRTRSWRSARGTRQGADGAARRGGSLVRAAEGRGDRAEAAEAQYQLGFVQLR